MKVRFLRKSVRVFLYYSLLAHIPCFTRSKLLVTAYEYIPGFEGCTLTFKREAWDAVSQGVHSSLNPIFPIVYAN